ncbi:GlsB/YeaQ/YmgE family stress response membrane protein [Ureibacillus thermophilus]|uniref:GlsB/YeaQ/YmgE family stress response membrane protein n=2 Tax=Ureibacillus thermophilus TaxID=367743 RepID=A0A4P6UW06_9BACL|nr:GlsB/YeaQ/YmgE family stress response membrane protein [Ureibacillus thermophilus]
MMNFIWYLVIGGIIGWLAGVIVGKDIPGGIIGNIIAGIIGSWIGSAFLGNWGWEVSNFYVFPALIGSIALVLIVSLIMKGFRKATD